MEMPSILLLILVLASIVFLTYLLYARQKRTLQKMTEKTEPRFDLVENSVGIHFAAEEEIVQENMYDTESENLLQDPLMEPVQVQKNREPEPTKQPKSSTEEIIYLMLKADPNKFYVGYELLQALLAAGLRFGAMNLFHRYENVNGNGKILFSLASASEKGTFELNTIGAFSEKGLIMFLKLSPQKDLIYAFDTMLDTAKQLIEDLGGEILDDERNKLTPEKIEKIKNNIHEFEQKQRIGDLFDE